MGIAFIHEVLCVIGMGDICSEILYDEGGTKEESIKTSDMISYQDTNSIPAEERLSICLWFLATGDSYRTIAGSFRAGISTVSMLIPDVVAAIWDCLVEEFLPGARSGVAPLQTIKVSAVWELLGPFPKTTDGYQYIFTATDYFSNSMLSQSLAPALLRDQIGLYKSVPLPHSRMCLEPWDVLETQA
uniref:Transposase Helix-turn-helix domain-containing protein n=1 Tax=Knipowitschia caucasica TaxID=637954 RepID=A0AAV2IX42_KNICA